MDYFLCSVNNEEIADHLYHFRILYELDLFSTHIFCNSYTVISGPASLASFSTRFNIFSFGFTFVFFYLNFLALSFKTFVLLKMSNFLSAASIAANAALTPASVSAIFIFNFARNSFFYFFIRNSFCFLRFSHLWSFLRFNYLWSFLRWKEV